MDKEESGERLLGWLYSSLVLHCFCSSNVQKKSPGMFCLGCHKDAWPQAEMDDIRRHFVVAKQCDL